MKAVRYTEFGGPEVLQLVDIEIPEPAAGQIRIKVKALGVNPIDWKFRSGKYPHRVTLPAGTGVDLAGVVDAVGDGVDDVVIGDEVFGLALDWAGAGEYAISHAWARKPESMNWLEAAALPLAAETAGRTLALADIAPNSTVLIDGASGAVGLTITQILLADGMRVIGTAGESNLELLADLGAIALPYGDDLADRLATVAPEGVDYVIDLSGRDIPGLIEIAGDPERVTGIVDHKLGPELGIRDTSGNPLSADAAMLRRVADLYDAGRFVVRVGEVFPLDRIGEAQAANQRGVSTGKVVVEF